jgi:hypothetical protein
MADLDPVEVTNLDRYGNGPLPWSRPRDLLATTLPEPGVPVFLATVRPDGRPHSAGIGVIWLEGDLYFTSGPETRKSRNLQANPASVVSIRLATMDLVLEGVSARVVDRPTLEKAASLYRDGGWPAEVDGDAFVAPFSAPSAGPPPWQLFRFTFTTAFGVATEEPHGATRWRFER